MKLLIKNAKIVSPDQKALSESDILIESGKISSIGRSLSAPKAREIDAQGKIVLPGLVDMHVHLRQPGREDKETVESATIAALKGGVTTLLAMPNTSPAIDSPDSVGLLKGIIERTARAEVLICAAITKGRMGRELTDAFSLSKAGVTALSDDGNPVDSEELMYKALCACRDCGMKMISHCEDKKLSKSGAVNYGFTSTKMGLRGISAESEYKAVERDIRLAKKADAPIHIAHVSCKESVEIIRRAKKEGVKVTAETAPHYFSLSEESVWGYDTDKKMNPPLRSREDVSALIEGLRDGTIDAIASDHAPHTDSEKDIEFERAEFGVIGLETELLAGITHLVKPGIIDWQEFSRKISLNPAKILGVDRGRIAVGSDADLVVCDPDFESIYSKEDIVSKSKNSAFLGAKLSGRVEHTIFKGEVVYSSV